MWQCEKVGGILRRHIVQIQSRSFCRVLRCVVLSSIRFLALLNWQIEFEYRSCKNSFSSSAANSWSAATPPSIPFPGCWWVPQQLLYRWLKSDLRFSMLCLSLLLQGRMYKTLVRPLILSNWGRSHVYSAFLLNLVQDRQIQGWIDLTSSFAAEHKSYRNDGIL